MNGFSQDLEKKTVSGKLFHSCTLEGALSLLNMYNDQLALCCSTEESDELFGREIVLVFEPGTYSGEYCFFDADAGKSYGYDEFRLTGQLPNIEKAIISDSLHEIWESDYTEDDTSEEAEIHEMLYELAENCIPLLPSDDKNFYNV